MKTPARCYLLCCQVRAGIRDAIEFNRSMTVFLDNENRRWVTTPRRYVAETWTYDLEVRVNRHHRSAGQLISRESLLFRIHLRMGEYI